jgi:hypothetical protein
MNLLYCSSLFIIIEIFQEAIEQTVIVIDNANIGELIDFFPAKSFETCDNKYEFRVKIMPTMTQNELKDN